MTQPGSELATGNTDLLAEHPSNPADYLPGVALMPPTESGGPTEVSEDLAIALASKPFVIFTGPSGTGKTRAGLRLAQALTHVSGDEHPSSSYALVPIGANWTDTRYLLGYTNPFGKPRQLKNGQVTNLTYEITDALRLLLAACHPKRLDIPHFLILDEMNLSHVERYFSPFLSLIEAGRAADEKDKLSLLDPSAVSLIADVLSDQSPNSVETASAQALAKSGRGLPWSPNVCLVGTVNVDETTYMFSPKVLDRAHVIEMHSARPRDYVKGVSFAEEEIPAEAALEILRRGIQRQGIGEVANVPNQRLIDAGDSLGLEQEFVNRIAATLMTLLDGAYLLLAPLNFGFGYRVVNEVYDYLVTWLESMCTVADGDPNFADDWEEAVDKVFLQKVLPKLHGNRRELGDSLIALGAFLAGNDEKSTPPAMYRLGDFSETRIKSDQKLTWSGEHPMKWSRDKLNRMNQRLQAVGYVTFVE